MTYLGSGAEESESPDAPPPELRWGMQSGEVRLAGVVQAATVLGGVAYGSGWAMAGRLYGQLGVAPEDVGITSTWLAVRAFTVVVLLAIAVRASTGLLRTRRFKGPLVGSVSNKPILILLLSSMTLVPFLISGLVVLFLKGPQLLTGAALLIAWIPTTAIVVRVRGVREPIRLGWDLRLWVRFLGAVLLSFACTAFIMFPFLYADNLARRVEKGQGFRAAALPGIVAFRADPVTVAPTSGQLPAALALHGTCYVRLGSADGTTVLYDYRGHDSIRVGNAQIIVHTGC